MKPEARVLSYFNRLVYIDDNPPPKVNQYMNYTHSFAWSFAKEERCNSNNI